MYKHSHHRSQHATHTTRTKAITSLSVGVSDIFFGRTSLFKMEGVPTCGICAKYHAHDKCYGCARSVCLECMSTQPRMCEECVEEDEREEHIRAGRIIGCSILALMFVVVMPHLSLFVR